MPARTKLRLVAPSRVNATVPIRPTNSELRTREYLTGQEVERLMKTAAKAGRYGHRDATLILLTYRHGLRAAEVADLQWSQVTLGKNAALHVRRVKNGSPSVHPLKGDEQRALRKLQRDYPDSDHLFVTQHGAPFSAPAVNRMIVRLGERAGMPFPVHAHMLRHSCGFALAAAGHDTRAIQAWLGHKAIQHTVRYTELSPSRFRSFWASH